MDIQIIGLWSGLFITFVLGLINFLWGPAILARREKVIIREPQLKISVVERDNGIERIFIQSSFKLVRIRGTQDLYIESAYLQLSKALCEELRTWFRIPPEPRIYWHYRSYYQIGEAEYKTLKFNEPRDFEVSENFDAGSPLLKLMKKLQKAQTEQEIEEKQSTLENLKEKARKLEMKYILIWIDGKGRTRQYRCPKKWFNKLLPERLWWRVA